MRIIAFGDVHMELGGFRNIPGIDTADFVLITGDLTNYGNSKDAKKILDAVMQINENVLALPGNLDERDVSDYLVELGLSLHGSGRLLDGIGIFGVGGSNITPFNTPTEFGEEELAAIAKACYRHLGLCLVEFIRLPAMTREEVRSFAELRGREHIEAALERRRGVILLTGHVGNWEMAGCRIAGQA